MFHCKGEFVQRDCCYSFLKKIFKANIKAIYKLQPGINGQHTSFYVLLDVRTENPKSETVFYWCDDGGGGSWQKGEISHSMGNFVPETIVFLSNFQQMLKLF